MIRFFVREIRKRKGISQEELAKISGVSASHIGYIENGERQPTLLAMCRIAKALDVDLSELYEFEE